MPLSTELAMESPSLDSSLSLFQGKKRDKTTVTSHSVPKFNFRAICLVNVYALLLSKFILLLLVEHVYKTSSRYDETAALTCKEQYV